MSALNMYYEKITTDWEGKLYCGISMKYDYAKINVDISMPGYLKGYLYQFNHKTTKTPQHQPYPATERTYGADAQKMKLIDTSPKLLTQQVKKIERIVEKLLYYVRGVKYTRLIPFSEMETQTDPIKQDEMNVHQFWDYIVTYLNSVCNRSIYPCTQTEEYYVRAEGQTIYLQDQTTRTPSLAKPPIQLTPPGTPPFTAPLHGILPGHGPT